MTKSIYAGGMIGIAGAVFLAVPDKVAGALLFSVGLVVVVLMEFHLYTGKVGYASGFKDIPRLSCCIVGNFIGVYAVSLAVGTDATAAVLSKLEVPLWLAAVKSAGCGFLMFAAVESYKRRGTVVGTVGCVAAFILAGFEHSIADMFFVCCSHSLPPLKTVLFLCVVVAGNAAGALLHKLDTDKIL